jgi:riboflavin synthase
MFTGIVRGIGRIALVQRNGDACRLAIDTEGLATDGWQVGDSVAVAGVCLTVASFAPARFDADLSGETIRRTTLGGLGAGSPVNLEPALAAGATLGGHLVSGHVDGVAQVRRVAEAAGSLRATIEAPRELARFIATKGSVTLDGVSLTVSGVSDATFVIDIVPHTRAVTTLGALADGQSVNLEVDLVARYLDRLLEMRGTK